MVKVNKKSKGFTLAELLIVVGIIAVLVAVSIPVLTTQLEKAREAVDLSNIRLAFEEISKASLDPASVKTSGDPYEEVIYTNGEFQMYVKVSQKQANWQAYDNAISASFAGGSADADNVGENAYWIVGLNEQEQSYAISKGN